MLFREERKPSSIWVELRGALASIKYIFTVSKVPDADKRNIGKQVIEVKSELIKFLYSESNDKEPLNNSIQKNKNVY